jgi:hypothetical protein
MAGIVRLEDDSIVHASNLGLAGALEKIGMAISDADPRLARWLLDLAQRPGGFMDFDLRGLSSDGRAAFWLGVDRANEKSREWNQEVAFSASVSVIRQFHEKRGIQGEADSKQVPRIDLDEIWFDGNTP